MAEEKKERITAKLHSIWITLLFQSSLHMVVDIVSYFTCVQFCVLLVTESPYKITKMLSDFFLKDLFFNLFFILIAHCKVVKCKNKCLFRLINNHDRLI